MGWNGEDRSHSLNYYTNNFLEATRKATKALAQIAGIRIEIRIENLQINV
jgi:hypothetical protein